MEDLLDCTASIIATAVRGKQVNVIKQF